jgi:hypothetical protein
MSGLRMALATALTFALPLAFMVPAGGHAYGDGLTLEPEVTRLIEPVSGTPELPTKPGAALVRAVSALSSALGRPLDPTASLAAARLPEGVSGRLALLVSGLHECYIAAAPARRVLSDQAVMNALSAMPAGVAGLGGTSLDLMPTAKALRACAGRLQSTALETKRFLAATPEQDRGDAVRLWPVLAYSPSSESDRYMHDYVLIVEGGGNDTYLNNAGGNLVDLRRGPHGSPAPDKAPARGCHKISIDFPGECFAAAALLLDMAGDDTYGALEDPDPVDDGFCTGDPLVRRIVTSGSGLAGVGVLVDAAGDDRHVGKTLAQGSGHLAGVGILRDEAGDDSYLAIRNAQGFALLAGFGLLREEGGDDVFERYLPGPLDPEAEYQRPGAGGVVDDRGTCDVLPRQLQGSAFLPGSVGLLVNVSGSDRYHGAAPAIQKSDAFMFPHGSQGYGHYGGVGVLHDMGCSTDVYSEVPDRADGVTIGPGPDSAGLFRDEGS